MAAALIAHIVAAALIAHIVAAALIAHIVVVVRGRDLSKMYPKCLIALMRQKPDRKYLRPLKSVYLFILIFGFLAKLVGELAGSYSTVVLMFGFAAAATAPALLISRMVAPRSGDNPVKYLPMECGQVPSGAGRTHFMMQYYAYILMFVVFDVMAIFLYAWGSTILDLPKSATLPIIAFLGIMFAAMAFALHQSRRRNIW